MIEADGHASDKIDGYGHRETKNGENISRCMSTGENLHVQKNASHYIFNYQ